jgi:hypothetical protein
MALTLINRNSAADVTLTFAGSSALTYKAQFSRFDMRAASPEIDVTTFAGEVSGEFDQGATRYTCTFAGITKKGIATGGAVTGTLLGNPLGVTSVWQWDTGCTVSGSFNFTDFTSSRVAGGTSVFAGTATGTSTITIAWVAS